jgi:hypothetical protein
MLSNLKEIRQTQQLIWAYSNECTLAYYTLLIFNVESIFMQIVLNLGTWHHQMCCPKKD